MGGGLMQLVAYGAQDIYLTSNPQITFFKVVYRRHTNFSREVIEQTHTGTTGPGKNINVTISRNGDLVHSVYIECDRTTTPQKVSSNPGTAMIDYVELEIGGQTIDKLYGHWIEVWARLSEENLTGNVGVINGSGITLLSARPELQAPNTTPNYTPTDKNASNVHHYYLTKYQSVACAGGVSNLVPTAHSVHGSHHKLMAPGIALPLPFWFCKNPGNALPLIALQYHEVKLDIKFSSKVNSAYLADVNPKVWVEYIYLDTAERRRFAQVSHEYLIEQVQRFDQTTNAANASRVSSTSLDLNFNHPVKELIFTCDYESGSTTYEYGHLPGWADHDSTVTLKLNGHDRFSADRRWDYFSRTQIWEHHTGMGNLYSGAEGYLLPYDLATAESNVHSYGYRRADQIGVYSFALKPEEHQPSGTCNFSRIDSTLLTFKNLLAATGHAIPLVVYAVNYNVLRIMSGMGGLAYSN